MPNTDMKQAALLSLYGIGNAGTGYQNPALALSSLIFDTSLCVASRFTSFTPLASNASALY